MPGRKCPVCKVRVILHNQARTCSHSCAREWKTWSYDMQARALSGEDDAELTSGQVEMNQAELDKWIRSNKTS